MLGEFENHYSLSFGNSLAPCTTAAVSGAKTKAGLGKQIFSDKVIKTQAFYELFLRLDNIHPQNNPPVSPIHQDHSNMNTQNIGSPQQFPSTTIL